MDEVDLRDAVLFIEAQNVLAEDAFKLEHNDGFVVPINEGKADDSGRGSRESTLLVRPPKAICWISLSRPPFNPRRGWAFGRSSDDENDFQLAEKIQSGVSTHYFYIKYNWTSNCLILTNVLRHHTIMNSASTGRMDVIIKKSRIILASEDTKINAGAVSLLVWVPKRDSQQQRGFNRRLDQFKKDAVAALPKLAGLRFREPPSETPPVVLGKRTRVPYVIESEGDLGRGAYGIVSKALDPVTGHLYAAKRFLRVDPAARREILLHERISHVVSPNLIYNNNI